MQNEQTRLQVRLIYKVKEQVIVVVVVVVKEEEEEMGII